MSGASSEFDRLLADGLRVHCAMASHRAVPIGYTTGWRVTPFAVVAGLSDGRCRAEIDGQAPRILRPGTMLCLRAGIAHRFSHPTPSVAVSSHLHFLVFGGIDVLSLVETPIPLPAACAAPAAKLIDQLAAAMRREREPLRDACTLQAHGFALLDLVIGASRIAPQALERMRVGQRLAPVLSAIERDLAEIDLSRMCRAAGLSRSHLHTVFILAVGRAPMAYVRWRRLQRARELLVATAHPISTVAELSGYGDQFHFSRAFKAAHGTSPSDYRAAFSDSML